jgi:hypothetical protein
VFFRFGEINNIMILSYVKKFFLTFLSLLLNLELGIMSNLDYQM